MPPDTMPLTVARSQCVLSKNLEVSFLLLLSPEAFVKDNKSSRNGKFNFEELADEVFRPTFLLAEGGALLFRPPTAEAKFITKSSLLLLKLNI
jgi:hypothetical protein